MHLKWASVQVGSVLLIQNILSCETWWDPVDTGSLCPGNWLWGSQGGFTCQVIYWYLWCSALAVGNGIVIMWLSMGRETEGLELRGSLLLVECWSWVSKIHWKWVKWRTIMDNGQLSHRWFFYWASPDVSLHSSYSLNETWMLEKGGNSSVFPNLSITALPSFPLCFS